MSVCVCVCACVCPRFIVPGNRISRDATRQTSCTLPLAHKGGKKMKTHTNKQSFQIAFCTERAPHVARCHVTNAHKFQCNHIHMSKTPRLPVAPFFIGLALSLAFCTASSAYLFAKGFGLLHFIQFNIGYKCNYSIVCSKTEQMDYVRRYSDKSRLVSLGLVLLTSLIGFSFY